MNAKQNKEQGKGAIELCEEAFHLVRRAPWTVLASYYIGALPFFLGLLYFWTDMSRGSYADERCAAEALGLTFLFVWMKSWQSVFTAQLKAFYSAELIEAPAPGRLLRIALAQGVTQATGLFLLPLALLATIPFAWVYAFYQNMTVLGNGESVQIRELMGEASRQSRLWPKQNHLALLILSAFGLFVFLNVISGILAVPFLLKTLFGLESYFTRNWWSAFNTTFLAATVCLAWLCVDPILKALYFLRCFYGLSVKTGEDIRIELQRLRASKGPALAAAALLALGGLTEARGAAATPAPAAPVLSAPEFNKKADEVLAQDEYRWRLPRVRNEREDRQGWLGAFLSGVAETLGKGFKMVVEWVVKVWRWLKGMMPEAPEAEPGGFSFFQLLTSRLLLYTLIAVAASILGVYIFRAWKNRRQTEAAGVAEAVAPPPDLADEGVTADQLPEDQWLTLARELTERGEFRQALRALFLASLAHLAAKEIISLAKFKSNRDYERELTRRARTLKELQATFSDNVSAYDRIWYGRGALDQAILRAFEANVQKIRAV